MKIKGSNSIFLLFFRVIFRLKWSWPNFLIPHVFALLSVVPFFIYAPFSDFKKIFSEILGLVLGFDGSILGFVIGSFAIFASFSDKEMTVFAVSNKREGDYYSFLKTKLLTFFKSFFWIFIGTSYALLWFGFLKTTELFPEICETTERYWSLFRVTSLYLLVYTQVKILVELKVLIFVIYNNSLTQARFMAQQQNVQPIDDTND